jgi:hypothetical protein
MFKITNLFVGPGLFSTVGKGSSTSRAAKRVDLSAKRQENFQKRANFHGIQEKIMHIICRHIFPIE